MSRGLEINNNVCENDYVYILSYDPLRITKVDVDFEVWGGFYRVDHQLKNTQLQLQNDYNSASKQLV